MADGSRVNCEWTKGAQLAMNFPPNKSYVIIIPGGFGPTETLTEALILTLLNKRDSPPRLFVPKRPALPAVYSIY